jgi:hypothetical protein
MDTTKLTNIGGKEWKKHGKNRIYLNDHVLYDLIDFEYKSRNGNIKTASLNGESVSKKTARGIINTINYAKVWYDVDTETLEFRDLDDVGRIDLQDLVTEAINAL